MRHCLQCFLYKCWLVAVGGLFCNSRLYIGIRDVKFKLWIWLIILCKSYIILLLSTNSWITCQAQTIFKRALKIYMFTEWHNLQLRAYIPKSTDQGFWWRQLRVINFTTRPTTRLHWINYIYIYTYIYELQVERALILIYILLTITFPVNILIFSKYYFQSTSI